MDNNYLYCRACFNGHLQLAQYLYQKNTSMDLSARNNSALLWACLNQHSNIVHWLLTIHKNLDCSYVFIHLFQMVLTKNDDNIYFILIEHCLVKKWFRDTDDIMITTFQSELVKMVRHLKKYAIENLIIGYLPPFLFDSLDKQISRQDARWMRRRYFVWLMSLQSPNQNCILFHLPKDMSRKIIMNYL
jgi:hypothetical protein